MGVLRQIFRLVMLMLLCLVLAGCRSGAGLFLPVDQHPDLMLEARQAVAVADLPRLDSLLTQLDKRTADSSHLLYLLEAARLQSLAGEVENSVELYAQVGERLDTERMRAMFTATESLQTALSMVTNDRALPYNGQLFERLLVYTFQALNYLQLGNPDLARIELNKALRDMRWGKDNLPQLRRESDQSLNQAGVRPQELPAGFSIPPDGLVQESSSDNALVYFLSGLLFEAAGDLDRAAIDYRNALAYAPGSPPVEAALNGLEDSEQGTGRLVILHETDWVSPRIPFSLPVFINERSYTLSFPYYTDRYWSDFAPESFIYVGRRQAAALPLAQRGRGRPVGASGAVFGDPPAAGPAHGRQRPTAEGGRGSGSLARVCRLDFLHPIRQSRPPELAQPAVGRIRRRSSLACRGLSCGSRSASRKSAHCHDRTRPNHRFASGDRAGSRDQY
jgi:tetratricopeptide (TPR) repeat protein